MNGALRSGFLAFVIAWGNCVLGFQSTLKIETETKKFGDFYWCLLVGWVGVYYPCITAPLPRPLFPFFVGNVERDLPLKTVTVGPLSEISPYNTPVTDVWTSLEKHTFVCTDALDEGR